MGKLIALRRQRDIDGLFRFGRRHKGRMMTVVIRPRPGTEARLLLAVGKKVGNAVVRNRVRRRMRVAFRSLLVQAGLGYDIGLIGYAASARADYHQLHDEMAELLRKAELLPDGQVTAEKAE